MRPGTKLGWFHLGADMGEIEGASNRNIEGLLDDPLLVTVSTVEPRKGHAIALDAFDMLWARGIPASYAIVGMQGWRSAALAQRIREHPQYGKRLLWLDEATDADLKHVYERAHALVFPSIDEGFGLPIIEAASHGARLILSDIPVFREIAGDEAQYFDLLSAEGLAREIDLCRGMERRKPQLEILSWREAAQVVFKLVRDDPAVREQWIS